MTILVLGATGATGRLLVDQLLERGEQVKAVVRSPARLSRATRQHAGLTLIMDNLLEMSQRELVELLGGCTGVASCLGHNLSVRGLFGPPYRLVTRATRSLCEAILSTRPERPVRFVLMNSAGNRNPDADPQVSPGQRLVVGLLRLLVPPHADNEQAADYLRTHFKTGDRAIEWVCVRPDSLIDENCVTGYENHPSPTRSAIFDAGQTSRINVAHFMAELLTAEATWDQWKGQMPMIYNQS